MTNATKFVFEIHNILTNRFLGYVSSTTERGARQAADRRGLIEFRYAVATPALDLLGAEADEFATDYYGGRYGTYDRYQAHRVTADMLNSDPSLTNRLQRITLTETDRQMTITLELATTLIDSALTHGGMTHDLTANDGRYVVGGLGNWSAPKDSASALELTQELGAPSALGTQPDTLGSWLDRSTDLVWVDFGSRHSMLSEAVSIGRDRGELAIYDSLTGLEITL